MPREKQGKRKTKGAAQSIVSILQKFLKTYEKRCVQTQTSVCPAIKRDLKASINHERILRKFVLVRPDDSPPGILPMSLEALLMTVRDECYMLGREICIWGFQLSNPEIARLALLLESKGHTRCPFTTLELIDCKMDPWSLGRLGQALHLSSLHVLVLDYCRFTHEEIESILSGLENNQRLQSLSLRYCGLGPQNGPRLGSIVCHSAIRELHLGGNYLQCSGALGLLRPLAEYAEMQGKDQLAISPPDTGNPPPLLQDAAAKSLQSCPTLCNPISGSPPGSPVPGILQDVIEGKNVLRPMLHKAQMFDFLSCSVSYLRLLVASCQRWAQKLSAADHQGARQRGSSPLNQIAESSRAVTVKHTSGKKRKKGIKKKIKDLIETGPWLVKLYLADNGIDGKGKEGENDLLELTQILTCLIKYSVHLKEIDLGNNVLGEKAAVDLLEALRARKTGKLPVLKITVTPQISSDTFRSIWKNSKKSSSTHKKKKKAKN